MGITARGQWRVMVMVSFEMMAPNKSKLQDDL